MSGGIGGIGRGTVNKLNDRMIRSFVTASRAGHATTKKLSDGGGLYLTLTPAGTAVWRLKYRINGREQLCSLGEFPTVGLASARAGRDKLKAQLAEGSNPVTERRIARAARAAASEGTFEVVAEAWLEKQRRGWSAIHYETSKRALERDVFPVIGKLPVSDITPAMVAQAIEAIANRGARDTAGKVLWNVSRIFRLAQARGLCRDNPAAPVHEVLPKRKEQGRRPAFLKWAELGDILRRAECAHLSPAVRLANRLCAFTAARVGNVVAAEWREFDLDAQTPTWIIPRPKMKAQGRAHDHKVILHPSIANELKAWRSLIGGRGYVFPSPLADQHITREAIEKVYRVTLGLKNKHSPHGWRAAFATLAKDHGFSRDVVELALDHVHDNDVARAYDRGERLVERIRLMEWWGTELLRAEQGAEVISFRRTASS
jgi:integrase